VSRKSGLSASQNVLSELATRRQSMSAFALLQKPLPVCPSSEENRRHFLPFDGGNGEQQAASSQRDSYHGNQLTCCAKRAFGGE